MWGHLACKKEGKYNNSMYAHITEVPENNYHKFVAFVSTSVQCKQYHAMATNK